MSVCFCAETKSHQEVLKTCVLFKSLEKGRVTLFLLHKPNKRNPKMRVGEPEMRVLRRQKSGYVFGIILCLTGLATLFIVLWKVWPVLYSAQDFASVLWASLWVEQFDLIQGVELKLIYFVVLGTVMLISGALALTLSREWLPLAGETALLQCPYCRKRWRTSPDKALIHCPHCRQLVHPKLAEK